MRPFGPLSRTLASASACAVAFGIGCQSMQPVDHDAKLAQSSKLIPAPVFEAPYDPSMPTVAVVVAPVRISAPVIPGNGDISSTIRTQFLATLGASPNFVVSDREAFEEIGTEQELAVAGVTHSDGPQPATALVGARYIIMVDVTDMQRSVVGDAKKDSVSLGPLGEIVGELGDGTIGTIGDILGATNPTFSNQERLMRGVVGIDVRVVDVATGAIVTVARGLGQLERKEKASSVSVAGIGSSSSQFEQSVLSHATRVAVEDAVLQVHSALKSGRRVAIATAPSS